MDELTEQVALALDRVKADLSLTETALATHLGISRNSLYRWRQGRFSKSFRTIIPLTVLANTPLPPDWGEQADDVRILAPLLAMPKIDA